jgi:geranylgeranyl pyrophosphate synthase
MVIAAGQIFGADDEKLLRTAAAVEMIHTYSLIHDDLPAMDDDDLRRGRETCHKKYGEATAILAGDMLQALAFNTIVKDELLTSETRIRILSALAEAAGSPDGMVAGQQIDLEAEGGDSSSIDVEGIHRRKTGALIRASAFAGAVIGNASDKELDIVNEIGENIGLLFQITDDILDMTQSSSVLGKTAGKDEAVSKATYPRVFGIGRSREIARELLEQTEALAIRLGSRSAMLSSIAHYVFGRSS